MNDKNIQGIWLSATPNRYASSIINQYIQNPYEINVTKNTQQMLVGLRQYYSQCTEQNKKKIVVQVLKQLKIDQCVIFCDFQQQEELKEYIEQQTQIPTIIIRNDEERKQSYQDFCDRKYRICIASNLISRGMDNRCVNLVINYDIPSSYSNYVQRCGRAGRAGHYGMILSLVTDKTAETWLRITQIGRLTLNQDIKQLPPKLNDIDHCWEYEESDIVF